MKQYYKVTAKCGHVGRGHYIAIAFPIMAENGKQAAAYTRTIPRVKHDHDDAILDVERITEEEYRALEERNRNDAYLCCTNVQQQRGIEGLESRLIPETDREPTYTRNRSGSRRMRRYEVGEYERRSEMEHGRFDEWIVA